MKLAEKSEWFRMEREADTELESPETTRMRTRRGKTENKYTEAIVFVPHTPEGELRKNLIQMEKNIGFKSNVRYVEELGTSVVDLLCKKDPKPQHCGCQGCMNCTTKPGQCTRRNVVYRITCGMCKNQGKTTYYFGESARTSYDRGLEDLQTSKPKEIQPWWTTRKRPMGAPDRKSAWRW